MLALPQGPKPPPRRWNHPQRHFSVLSLSQLPLLSLHEALTALGPPISTHSSQELPKAGGPSFAPRSVLFPGLPLKGKQVEPRVVFPGSNDGKVRGQDPATMKSGWVPKIQGIMPWARKVCPPVQRSSPSTGQPPRPTVTPVERASAPGTPEPCLSTPLHPQGLPGNESIHQRPTQIPTAAPRFPSRPSSP